MKRTALLILAAVLLMSFVVSYPAAAEPSSSSSIAGGNTPSSDKMPKDKRTDLTGGQQGIPDEYSTTPVRQGSLKEVTDSKWLNQPVTNNQGEKLGTIKKVLKDEKTQNIEYVFLEIADSREARPMKWSQFQQNGGIRGHTMQRRDRRGNMLNAALSIGESSFFFGEGSGR